MILAYVRYTQNHFIMPLSPHDFNAFTQGIISLNFTSQEI